MQIRKKISFALLTGLIPVLFLGGCSGSAVQPAAETEGTVTAAQETEGPATTAEETEGSVTVAEETTASVTPDRDILHPIPRMINQRQTSFGDYGCSGAAGLMALQAAGYMTDIDTDEEYGTFWSGVPKSTDPTKGWNGNGIWNPAYADWLGTFAEAGRIRDFSAGDLKTFIEEGNVAIVLVSLGDTGDVTHWMAVTGFKTADGLLLYEVADPWSGMLHEFTTARLQKRMEEGAKRKGDYGAGYETDGVLIKCLAL